MEQLPSLATILEDAGAALSRGVLLVCDTNTEYIAKKILGSQDRPLCVLESGETRKGWASVEHIITAAKGAGLGRDGLFIGIGGGVVTDMTSFAASVYMRGARLCLISTTLLGMVDAAVGGKTGFDLLGIKNLVGTFFPASHIYMPLDALKTLPPREWKSGMAELIKTAVLDSAICDAVPRVETGETQVSLDKLKALGPFSVTNGVPSTLGELIERAVLVKGRIVEADPKEQGTERALLNLGHTFGHALEAAAGLGNLSHGEAVAWGMVRACELGLVLGITPESRARKITEIIAAYDYETTAPHPSMTDAALFMQALAGDKKRKPVNLPLLFPMHSGRSWFLRI
ncbi:3-dehydroquinate synthase [Treponema primitia]|uniref:3-dehydroquinate synthase n=1 Tax=Treponema primitia TaxID=88058 RepID=UPI0002555611|nr:3-dehydroquinate synthase family protein [Treponema primitia]